MTPEGYRIVKEVLETADGITLEGMTEPEAGEDVAEVVVYTRDTPFELVLAALHGAGILEDSPNTPANPDVTPKLVALVATQDRIRFHDQNTGVTIFDD